MRCSQEILSLERIGKGTLNVKHQWTVLHVYYLKHRGLFGAFYSDPEAPGGYAIISKNKEGTAMKYVVLLGRALYAAIFIIAGPGHFSAGTISYAAHQGVPMASIVVPLSGLMALIGGLSILVGYFARYGAWLIVIFLVPVTLIMHRFWGIPNPSMAQIQQIMFMKNLSMLGAALLITHFGSGPFSFDSRNA